MFVEPEFIILVVSKLKLKKEYRNELMYQNAKDLFNI